MLAMIDLKITSHKNQVFSNVLIHFTPAFNSKWVQCDKCKCVQNLGVCNVKLSNGPFYLFLVLSIENYKRNKN